MSEAPGRVRSFFDRLPVQLSLSIAVALLPLGIIALVQTQAFVREAQGRSQSALAGVTLRSAATEARLIYEARGIANSLAETLPTIHEDDPAACDAEAADVIAQNPGFSALAYVTLDGDVRCSSDGSRINITSLPMFELSSRLDEPGFYSSTIAPISNVAVVGASSPTYDDDGNRMGFVAVSIPRARGPVVEPGTPLYAVERNSILVTFGPTGEILTSSIPIEQAEALLPVGRPLSEFSGGGEISFQGVTAAGEARIYSVVPVVPGQFYAMGSWPRSFAEIDLGQSLSPLFLPVSMFLASLFVAWFAADRLVLRHLRSLGRSMALFAGGGRIVGDLRAERAPIELRELSTSFLAMTDTILRDEAELEDTIHQKEVLLREVHHRVKNNLQLIASIMNLQMRTAHSAEAKRLIRSLQERVMSLATVHKELYHTSGLTEIHADELLSEILQQILRMSATPGRPIDLETSFAPVQLLPDQAVPVALFVTEALTNALRYSTLSPASGMRLIARLDRLEGSEEARIEIANSQPDPGADRSALDGGTGLGHRLLAAFAAQTGGRYEIVTDEAFYRVVLTFTPLAPSGD